MKRGFTYLLILLLLGIGSFFIYADTPVYRGWGTPLLKTGQITAYLIGDDGDKQKGITKAYVVNSAGSQSGNATVDSPHYAAATISFTAATDTIADSASGLVTVLTGDTVRIRGSGTHDTVYTVKAGTNAASFTVDQDITADEAAGAYITICKRATHSNNVVLDSNTGLIWARYVQTGKIGPASDGKLNWYDATKCYTLHPANADVGMVAGNILRIVGLDEASRFFAGAVLVCSGFANAVNNLPGLIVKSVSFTGGNTDIVVDPGNQTLIAEATGNFGIKIVCRSIYSYCAAANVALLGGYGDWGVPNIREFLSLISYEIATGVPNSTAFPGFPALSIWTSSTPKTDSDNAWRIVFNDQGRSGVDAKISNYQILLVCGG